jgi:spore coat polysaccharide biosynthesis protein SpsF
MSSARLPGKVLVDLEGHSVLATLLRRVKRARTLTDVVVVTSSEHSDEPIAEAAASEGVEVYRGSLTDVASRFFEMSRRNEDGCIVRICADSPFSDPGLIDAAVRLFWRSEPTLVSTTTPRTTPHGMSVEVLQCRSFIQAYSDFDEPDDKEHVTRYFYRHPERYEIVSYRPELPIPLDYSLAIDTTEDLLRMRQLASALGERAIEADCLEILTMAERLWKR